MSFGKMLLMSSFDNYEHDKNAPVFFKEVKPSNEVHIKSIKVKLPKIKKL